MKTLDTFSLLRGCGLICLVAALGACTTSRSTHRVWPPDEPAVVGAPVAPPPGSAPEPLFPDAGAADALPQYPRSAEEISGAAVTSLMRQARSALSTGQPDQAAAALERALRIEPRNYFVWSMLGQSYLAQNNYAQADSVARKSNALARGNVYAEVMNWRTIAAARAGLGDGMGAQAANARVLELEQWLYARSGQ